MALPSYTVERRREMAALLEIDEQYLYQICRGLSTAGAALARRIHEIDPQAALQDLRPDDWQAIWPELVTPEAATEVAAIASTASVAAVYPSRADYVADLKAALVADDRKNKGRRATDGKD